MLLQNEETEQELFIPFSIEGVIFVIKNTREPTDLELEQCPVFWATSEEDWNPYSRKFAKYKRNCSAVKMDLTEQDLPLKIDWDLYF